jgi:hypothetical protein
MLNGSDGRRLRRKPGFEKRQHSIQMLFSSSDIVIWSACAIVSVSNSNSGGSWGLK